MVRDLLKSTNAMKLFLVVALLVWASGSVLAELPGTVRVKTLQNLGGGYESEIFAKFLTLGAAGKLALGDEADQNHSGAFWALRMVHPDRGFRRTFSIESRANNATNGMVLGVDQKTGELRLFKKHHPQRTSWIVRYVGKEYGWDAWIVQTTSSTPRGIDLRFLSLDAIDGSPTLSSKLDATGKWFMAPAPDLPDPFGTARLE